MTCRLAPVLMLLTLACVDRPDSMEHSGERRMIDGAIVPPAVETGGFEAGVESGEVAFRNPYADNVDDGRRFYMAFNCHGCHGVLGGGGIGPPFVGESFIYGVEPENVYQSIVQGRPEGMPAFGGRIPEHVVWQIVAYVRSLSPVAGQKERRPSPGAGSESDQGGG